MATSAEINDLQLEFSKWNETSSIVGEPPELIPLQLKRYANVDEKIKTHINLGNGQVDLSQFFPNKNAAYEIVGGCIHYGNTLRGGHYISIMQKDGEWFRCDDSRITCTNSNLTKIPAEFEFTEQNQLIEPMKDLGDAYVILLKKKK